MDDKQLYILAPYEDGQELKVFLRLLDIQTQAYKAATVSVTIL